MTKKTKKTKSASRRTKLPIPHWVCIGGCGFIANERVACPNSSCRRYRNYLTECRCRNGKHGDLPTRNVPKGLGK